MNKKALWLYDKLKEICPHIERPTQGVVPGTIYMQLPPCHYVGVNGLQFYAGKRSLLTDSSHYHPLTRSFEELRKQLSKLGYMFKGQRRVSVDFMVFGDITDDQVMGALERACTMAAEDYEECRKLNEGDAEEAVYRNHLDELESIVMCREKP